MPSIAIVDSGPLVAVANRADPDHRACLAAMQTPGLHLMIPVLCVAEAAYLLAHRGASPTEARFVRGLRDFDVAAPAAEDWARIADLVEGYADLPLGSVDASVVTLAERVGTDLLITLDRRHFSVVHPAGADAFQLLPEHAPQSTP